MNPYVYVGAAVLAALLFAAGVGTGWHEHTVRDNAAIVKQVVHAAKVEAKHETQVEKQDATDTTLVGKLQADLVAARAAAAARGVPNCPARRPLPATEANAGAGSAPRSQPEPVGGYEAAYREFRDESLNAGAVAEQLRLQVLSCQVQWPTSNN